MACMEKIPRRTKHQKYFQWRKERLYDGVEGMTSCIPTFILGHFASYQIREAHMMMSGFVLFPRV